MASPLGAQSPSHVFGNGYELSDGEVTVVVSLQLVAAFLSLLASAAVIASMVPFPSPPSLSHSVEPGPSASDGQLAHMTELILYTIMM